VQRALAWGPHKSVHEYIEYLGEEFVDMINKGQWVILPYSAVQHLPGLRISPPGVIPQQGRRTRWIVDYPLAATEAMKLGHALDRILWEILLSNPKFGLIYLIKLDISDGFYRIALNVDDIPKLGVAFPTAPGEAALQSSRPQRKQSRIWSMADLLGSPRLYLTTSMTLPRAYLRLTQPGGTL
jgi:hypothetical protein